jgi:hypothetical protein
VSSKVENQIFTNQNDIEQICDTLIKFDVQTLWITVHLGFCQMISLADNSSSSKTKLGIKISLDVTDFLSLKTV